MAFCADRIINDTCIAWDRLKGSNVLITGGTGLVGSVITRALIEANRPAGTDIAITLLVRNTDKARKIFGDDINSINLIESDLTDGQDIEGSYDFIIHCAAVTASSVMVANPVETIDLSYRGTHRMLELARKCSSKGMVYVSSMEVYGVTDESMNPVTEDRLGYVDLGNVRSSYQESKRICELLCNSYASEYKVPVCSARLAQTFGAGVSPDEGRVFAQFAKSVTDGRDIVLHTTGESYGNYCDTTDMAAAVLCLLTSGVPGEAYNVANEDNSCMIREMAQMCADTLAEGRIKVVYDISDSYGYAPATKLKLSSAKMRSLGWTPLYSLEDMYRSMMDFWASQET